MTNANANWANWKKKEDERKAQERESLYQVAIEKVKEEKENGRNSFAIPTEHEIKMKETGEAFSVRLDKKDFEDKNDSPFAYNNPYNYSVNITHPAIFPHYQRYKNSVNETILSDTERFDFERHILSEYNRIGVLRSDYNEKPEQKEYSYGR